MGEGDSHRTYDLYSRPFARLFIILLMRYCRKEEHRQGGKSTQGTKLKSPHFHAFFPPPFETATPDGLLFSSRDLGNPIIILPFCLFLPPPPTMLLLVFGVGQAREPSLFELSIFRLGKEMRWWWRLRPVESAQKETLFSMPLLPT